MLPHFLEESALEHRLSAALSDVENPEQDLVRLHVIADSDDPEAQALKLEVRDAVLEEVRQMLSDCDSAALAYARLTANLPALERIARDRASECGYTGGISAETGTFDFPDRDYAGTLVPAGRYRALRIVIGEGKGKNWWCVLFPTLCGAEADAPCYSIVGEWLSQWFGGDGK